MTAAGFALHFALCFALHFGLRFALRFAPAERDRFPIAGWTWHRGRPVSLTSIPARGSTP